MASSDFTPRQRENGRNNYFVYQLFNVIAFTLLSGNILTLYSLRLGADSFFIGLLSAVANLGFLLMIAGRQIIRRVGARKQWGISWLLRNSSMIPALFAPVAAAALSILQSISSLPHLFNTLRRKNAPPYLRDEIILSIADLLGMGDWFYGMYSHFLKQAKTGIDRIIDYLKDCGVNQEILSEVSAILSKLQSGRNSFSRQVAERLSEKHADTGEIIPQLIAVANDSTLMRLDRLAFLMAAILARLECKQLDIR